MKIVKIVLGLGLIFLLISSFTGCSAETDNGGDTPTVSDGDTTLQEEGGDESSESTETDPIVLSLDTPVSGDVDAAGTEYYTFTTTGALAYEVTISDPSNSDLQMTVYAGATTILTSSGTAVFSAVEGTVCKFLVTNTGSTEATYTITVTEATAKNEGTVESPVALTLETTHAATVGMELINAENSYYTFTTDAEGVYDITTSVSSVSSYLYSDASFSALVDSDVWGGDLSLILDANTTYYLRVQNELSSNKTFDLKVAELGAVNEGEAGAPIALTLDVQHAAKVGSNDWNFDDSYYSITTTETAVYVISILNATPDDRLDLDIYSDINFTNLLGGVDNSPRITAKFDGNTTFYLKIHNYYGNNNMTYDLAVLVPDSFFTITEDENASNAPVAVMSDTQYTAHVGTSATGGENSYYKYTTGNTDEIVFTAFTSATPSADLDLYVYSDAGYSEQIGYSSSAPLWTMMSANTTYYIKVHNYSNADDVTYTLLMQLDPQ